MSKIYGMRLQELAVAVIIGGLVIATTAVWFIDFKKSERDARREGDIKQIQKELINYFSEHREYPATKELYSIVQGIPNDPNGGRYGYENVGGDSYVLGACLEGARGADVKSYSRADAENFEISGSGVSCTCASMNAYCINPDL
jgi:type II secretory pathway pseudopilin PulG